MKEELSSELEKEEKVNQPLKTSVSHLNPIIT